jgi:hypothetical protein
MPTNKDQPLEKVESKLLSLKRSQTKLACYRELLSDSRAWLARADRLIPEGGTKVLKALEAARTSAEKTFTAQQLIETPLQPVKEVLVPIDWSRIPDVTVDQCHTFRGVAQTRFSIVGTPIELPSDSDTDWEFDATLYDPPSRSYQSLMYKHWMQDKTHWYSFDTIDMMWVLSHLGYEFPAPECDGTMSYEANLSLIVSAFISAEIGLLSDELLVQEIPDSGANPSAPGTFEAYSRSFGQLNFSSTDYKTLDAVITGSFKVHAGKKSRVWFGISGICTALEGYAGTNGYCYLMVKPATGESQPGVKYAFVPV